MHVFEEHNLPTCTFIDVTVVIMAVPCNQTVEFYSIEIDLPRASQKLPTRTLFLVVLVPYGFEPHTDTVSLAQARIMRVVR